MAFVSSVAVLNVADTAAHSFKVVTCLNPVNRTPAFQSFNTTGYLFNRISFINFNIRVLIRFRIKYSCANQICFHERPPITEEEYKAACEELAAMPRKKGRPNKRKAYLLSIVDIYEKGTAVSTSKLSVAHQKTIDDMEQQAASIKNSKYTLGKNPENLTQAQKDKLKLIKSSCPQVYQTYRFKEQFRAILHMHDLPLATVEHVEDRRCGYL